LFGFQCFVITLLKRHYALILYNVRPTHALDIFCALANETTAKPLYPFIMAVKEVSYSTWLTTKFHASMPRVLLTDTRFCSPRKLFPQTNLAL
jgi:hypothetical protein